MSTPFEHTRGTREAYARYLQGMDASMRQKVALTAALMLGEGRVADMGMGSGAGSEALAALYPKLNVVGVDLDPTMVELARSKYQRPNLSFEVGDIANPPLEAESCSGIFNSSVLHHVTSFGGYRYDNAADALQAQVRALASHGVLIVRDFVAPNAHDPDQVDLDLPCNDGDNGSDPLTCSSAALFRRFASEFRAEARAPGFALHEAASPLADHARFVVPERLAVEFLLRKDYRADWLSEVKEEYAYYTQSEFEAVMRTLGLRILASAPLRNPWIVRNRLLGKYTMSRAGTALLDPPATNYLIAAEKVPDAEGVAFVAETRAPGGSFLRMSHYRNKKTGALRDLVQRPHITIDALPYFELEGSLYVVARMSYPRPVAASPRERNLDGSVPPHYVTEPLNVLQTDAPLGLTVESMLEQSARIGTGDIRRIHEGARYYPSPGGIQEEVRSVLVEVAPRFVASSLSPPGGLSSGGRVRAMDAEQVLRAAQVGGLPDARLELNTYELLLQRNLPIGPWIGESIALPAGPFPSAAATWSVPHPRRAFERTDVSANYLALETWQLREFNGRGQRVGETTTEIVRAQNRSTNTIACALLANIAGEICLGVDDDDLPAAQAFQGSSALLVCPAWRLPREVTSMQDAHTFVRERVQAEYGATIGERWELGGPYYPSLGISPEVAFPMAVHVRSLSAGPSRTLTWLPLRELRTHRAIIHDGHLRIIALRAAHACGVL